MKKNCILCIIAVFALSLSVTCTNAAERVLKMSTTTSTQASGLLDVLLPEFEKDTGIKVKVIAKGTGAALRDGMDGNVDIIFVHARERENQFIQEGYGTKRYGVMHNDFIIVGPPDTLAGIKGMKDVVAVLKEIAASRIPFVSRGDDSGTHTKEQELWRLTGLVMEQKIKASGEKNKKSSIAFLCPSGLGKWYISIGQGMGKTLTFANEKHACTLVDRGTYIKYKFGSDQPISLDILCEGDKLLANPYGVIPVNPARHAHLNYKNAKTLADWLVSERGQKLISNYKLLGKQLFFPDAIPIQ